MSTSVDRDPTRKNPLKNNEEIKKIKNNQTSMKDKEELEE